MKNILIVVIFFISHNTLTEHKNPKTIFRELLKKTNENFLELPKKIKEFCKKNYKTLIIGKIITKITALTFLFYYHKPEKKKSKKLVINFPI